MSSKFKKQLAYTFYEATLCNGETIDLPLMAEILILDNGPSENSRRRYQREEITFTYTGTYDQAEVSIFLSTNFDEIERAFIRELAW